MEQQIPLPPPMDVNVADANYQKIICKEAIEAIAKRKARLDSALKKG
jgi:hypothetical protein